MRFFCFIIISTAGMLTIGIALLAQPLAGYYNDQAIIQAQSFCLEEMKNLLSQQQELLNNVNNPSIIARAAIDTMNYAPADSASGQVQPLPRIWPNLEKALARIDQKQIPPTKPGNLERLANMLSRQQLTRSILLILGGALVIISLTFFYRQK